MNGGQLAQVRTAIHAYRHLGPRRGTAAAARHIAGAGRGRVRAMRLRRWPLQVAAQELRTALGGRDIAASLAAAGEALPSVRHWQEELSGLTSDERADLIRRADDILAHRFDLLGSGPTELGPEIDWHRDFKSDRSWPLQHFSQIRVSYPDGSDIKVPWDLSRFQHLPVLAAASAVSGDTRYRDEIGAQLLSWITANPVEFGVNWACTMDVAIRAANWVAALVLLDIDEAHAPPAWLEAALRSLLLHGRFIRGNLEYGPARGNHYLADVVGLLVVAGVFSGGVEGRGWAQWATRELDREMRHTVRSDGCAHEASTSYHRLVTELFIVGADAADAIAPRALDPSVRARLELMLAFVVDYMRPDGLAPQIGDVDDGRFLPLRDYGAADQRCHLHLFRQARRSHRPSTRSAAYPAGGFYFLRAGGLYAAVRCGDVGIYGRGCHAHNDLLAFELSYGTTPLIVDPGSYVYTADPVARNHFRSTAVHSAMQIDGAEQNELREDRLFAMVDRARASVITWEAGPATAMVCGEHRGFEALPVPAVHRRTLRLDALTESLEIVDEVRSAGPHEVAWCFPLAPCDVELRPGGIEARFQEITLHCEAGELEPTVDYGWISPRYGVRIRSPFIRLRGRSGAGEYQVRIVVRAKMSE